MLWLTGFIITAAIGLGAIFHILLLRNDIKEMKHAMEAILKEPTGNKRLCGHFSSRNLEELAECVNQYITWAKNAGIENQRRETGLRRQIENISHDLRTPLTSMIGYAALMDHSSMSKEDRENLDIIERRAKSLQYLIGSFYDLTRLEQQDYIFRPERLDLHSILTDTLLEYYRDFEKRGILVQPGLAVFPVWVRADSGALQRIISNLIQNSLRYALSFVRIEEQREETVYRLIWSNDCEPIKEKEAEHLFERFYEGSGSKESQSTGLGLAVVKLLMEKMEFQIQAEWKDGTLAFVLEFGLLV